MIAATIAALIGNYMTTCFVIGLIVAAVQIARYPGRKTGTVVSGLVLNAFVFWGIGCAQAVNFVMHSVFGDYAAKTIGWAQSPFQLELAFSSLGVAVMAFILYGKRSQFRGKVALVLALVVFGYGAAGGHFYQMFVNHNHAVNNGGLLLFSDLFVSTFGLMTAIWHAVARTRDADVPTDATATRSEAIPQAAGR